MTRVYGLTQRRLLVHPPPLPDELLTHWFLRLAHENGFKAQGLADYAFGYPSPFWARDYDRQASPEVVGRLAELTGRDPADITALTLFGSSGAIHPDQSREYHFVPWVLPLGVYHRKRRRFGTQFCPLCLFEDPEPYFRRTWRLAFATVCDRHGISLHDRCPACESPVIWFRNDLGHRRELAVGQSARCWQCGFDLRRAPAIGPAAIDGQSMIALQSLISFHEFGWWFVGDRSIQYSHMYFDVLRHLVSWLPGVYGRRLLSHVADRVGWPVEYPEAGAFEHRPIADRHRLVTTAVWLLQEWPDRFIQVAREVGLTQAYLRCGNEFPFWFASEVRQSLGARMSSPTAEEAASAAAYLRGRGKNLSMKALGRLVGSRDAQAVRPYAKKKSEPLSDEEFWEVIDRLTAEIRRVLWGGRRWQTLWRDRTMFIVERLSGLTASKVRQLTVTTGFALTRDPGIPEGHRRRIAGHLLSYRRWAWPRLMAGREGEWLFPAVVTGKPMTDMAWRMRWFRALSM